MYTWHFSCIQAHDKSGMALKKYQSHSRADVLIECWHCNTLQRTGQVLTLQHAATHRCWAHDKWSLCQLREWLTKTWGKDLSVLTLSTWQVKWQVKSLSSTHVHRIVIDRLVLTKRDLFIWFTRTSADEQCSRELRDSFLWIVIDRLVLTKRDLFIWFTRTSADEQWGRELRDSFLWIVIDRLVLTKRDLMNNVLVNSETRFLVNQMNTSLLVKVFVNHSRKQDCDWETKRDLFIWFTETLVQVVP